MPCTTLLAQVTVLRLEEDMFEIEEHIDDVWMLDKYYC